MQRMQATSSTFNISWNRRGGNKWTRPYCL